MSRDVTFSTDHDGADLVRSCTRKKGYPSENVARLAIDTIRRKNPVAEVRPYACRSCGQWHVGATPLDERRPDLGEVRDADRIRMRIGINKPRRRRRAGEPRRSRPDRRDADEGYE